MTTHLALLRGIMPTNPNMHPAKLKEAFEKMGFENVRTVIASGNVIFETKDTKPETLEKTIEEALPNLLGFSSSTIVRSKESIEALIKHNPFSGKENGKPNVTFFKKVPDPKDLPKHDDFGKAYGLVEGAFCFTVDLTKVKTPEVMLRLEKQFGKGITTRTWQTVERIFKKMQSSYLYEGVLESELVI